MLPTLHRYCTFSDGAATPRQSAGLTTHTGVHCSCLGSSYRLLLSQALRPLEDDGDGGGKDTNTDRRRERSGAPHLFSSFSEVSPSKKAPAAGAGATGIRVSTAGLSSPSSSSSSLVQRQERGRQRYRGHGEEMLRNQECSSPTRVHLRRTGTSSTKNILLVVYSKGKGTVGSSDLTALDEKTHSHKNDNRLFRQHRDRARGPGRDAVLVLAVAPVYVSRAASRRRREKEPSHRRCNHHHHHHHRCRYLRFR